MLFKKTAELLMVAGAEAKDRAVVAGGANYRAKIFCLDPTPQVIRSVDELINNPLLTTLKGLILNSPFSTSSKHTGLKKLCSMLDRHPRSEGGEIILVYGIGCTVLQPEKTKALPVCYL